MVVPYVVTCGFCVCAGDALGLCESLLEELKVGLS